MKVDPSRLENVVSTYNTTYNGKPAVCITFVEAGEVIELYITKETDNESEQQTSNNRPTNSQRKR